MRPARPAAALAALAALIAAASAAAAAGLAGNGTLLAGNALDGGRIDHLALATAPADLAPAACAALGITDLVTGRGDVRAPSSRATLVLGSAAADKLRGADGDDCLVGGAGQNEYRGEGGYDVCIGPAERPDRYESCEVVLP